MRQTLAGHDRVPGGSFVKPRLVAVTLLLIVVALLTAYAVSSRRYGGTWILSASQASSAAPGSRVSVEGLVLSSETRDGRMALSVANSTGPRVQRLSLEYSGSRRVHFEPGVTVIAHGRMRSDGVFEVEDFVLKYPSAWGG